ncbi:NACHT domain-containing protein [Streptomyces olivaceus]|uniref:NACHT domain-containing protein n=1 Tax=Streptomyces olivaceus TaxID=47716 RepID=UPI0036CA4270
MTRSSQGIEPPSDPERFILTDHATRAPLLILGHPGSGKSLLTKLIAARLPALEYFCQRIELRHLPADLDIQQQLEDALLRTTGLRTVWPEVTAPSADTLRVVLLDGLDELLQAAADHIDPALHYNYLHDVAQFQQRETDHGRPTVVIVTSRTVVADQVLTPRLSTVIRLESLDEDRIRRWLDIWNATNRRYFTTHDLQPLTWAAVEPHRDLASQPLLLLMLALYDASHNALRHLHGADIGRIGLYERLLTEFVRRQITKEHRALPAHAQAAAVEHELQRLAVIAIGMFNRRRQAITATTAHSDLARLLGTPPPEPSPLLFGRFFFVHEAQATVTGEEHRSYEFLHATFGEYLLTRLITGELHDLVAAHTIDRSAPVDDGRLYALLSHVPLTDRAEVLRNTSDLLTLLSEPQRAYLITLLSHLFQHVPGDTSHRTHLPYPTASVHRTRQDAIYSANLLLLAVLAHDGTRASDLLGPHNTLNLWRRSTQLWRSQLSDASWDTYTRTLTAQPFTDPETRIRDLRIDLCESTPGQDLAWAVNLATSDDTPAVVRHTEDTDPTDLHRSAAFMHDTSTQHLLHALAPLLHRLPATPQTFHALDSQHSSSAAHALISLLFRTAATPREPQAPYTEILTLLQALPGDERPLAADILARHIFHAASGMPAAAVTELLDQLTMTRFTASG